MEYMGTVISEAIESSFKKNLELRRGVPVGFFRSVISYDEILNNSKPVKNYLLLVRATSAV
jgi:hypothetical protein